MADQSSRPTEPAEAEESNPFIRFMFSEAWAGLASIVVYLFFRVAAFVTEWIGTIFPLHSGDPAAFVELVFGWSAALTSTATFTIITIYELVRLVKRFWEDLRE